MIESKQRLPITTYLGHVDRALGFYESDSVYFALGKTSKWDDTENDASFIPPEPELTATSLEELACLKKVTQKLLVYPEEGGEINFNGTSWKILTPEQAITLQSRWVYLTTTLYYDEVDLLQYRQVGIFNRVKPAEGVTNTLLLPGQVEDLGLLIALNNRGVVTRQTDTRDTYSLIIEF